jgi:hypothetical protein
MSVIESINQLLKALEDLRESMNQVAFAAGANVPQIENQLVNHFQEQARILSDKLTEILGAARSGKDIQDSEGTTQRVQIELDRCDRQLDEIESEFEAQFADHARLKDLKKKGQEKEWSSWAKGVEDAIRPCRQAIWRATRAMRLAWREIAQSSPAMASSEVVEEKAMPVHEHPSNLGPNSPQQPPVGNVGSVGTGGGNVTSNGNANLPPEVLVDTKLPFPITGATSVFWPSGTSGSTYGLNQLVEGTLREVLAYRPRTADPRGFVAALTNAFTTVEVEGHTETRWTPRSYSVQIQSDMGAITGAQASIYTRAKVALDASLPLLEGLYPLNVNADPELCESLRNIVRERFINLVNELGREGGPRVPRVNIEFEALLGNDLRKSEGGGPAKAAKTPSAIRGALAQLSEELGLNEAKANDIDEEQNVTNFMILSQYISGLQLSWKTDVERYFNHQRLNNETPFLGTQLVLISRMLENVVASVDELTSMLESVLISRAEQETIYLHFDNDRMSIAELLSWIRETAAEQAPRFIQDAGRIGVGAISGEFDKLEKYVESFAKVVTKDANVSLRAPRVIRSIQELHSDLTELNEFVSQLLL